MKVHKNNPSWMVIGMATVLMCMLLFSCNNEGFLESGEPEKACDNICFGISSDKNVQTRGYACSDDEGYTAGRFMLRSDDSADTLCVRAIVSEGINVSGFEGKQVLTRATLVGKDNFYDKFHVLAYWNKNGTPVNQFYMDTNASNSAASVGTAAIWSTEQTYYWPGADHSFQFYAWAPTDASGLTTPSSPQEKSLAYIVPEAVANQKDIVVATTDEIRGDNKAAVPLAFKHICTAVRFAVGSQMQPGSIKSVALKGVKNAGTYDMAGGTWSLGGTTANFSQTLNKATTGTEANGEAITSPEGTFMMLPQTLPAGATVEVVFTNASGVDRTLSASIAGSEWTMGTTVTYKLSVTPEYEFDIEVPMEAQDAHYITFPITVNVKDYDGTWTLTSNLTNDVFFTKTKTDLQKQGYWIDEDKGTNTISGTGSGSFTYHVYVTENIGDAARDLQFQITPDVAGAAPTIATVQQLCPSWNAQGVGYERIEENNGGNYPFGFKWDRKVVYRYEGFWAFLFKWAAEAYENTETKSYLTITWKITSYLPPWKSLTTVSLDYSKIGNSLNVGMDTENGLYNTRNLYFFKDIGGVSEMETNLDAITVRSETWNSKTVDGGDYQSVRNFAVKMAVMKNKFSKEKRTETDNGETLTYYVPIITEQDIKWYLPASSEQSSLSDVEYPLSGIYWSSTVANDNINAITYDATSNTTTIDRMTNNKIRAVRKKP